MHQDKGRTFPETCFSPVPLSTDDGSQRDATTGCYLKRHVRLGLGLQLGLIVGLVLDLELILGPLSRVEVRGWIPGIMTKEHFSQEHKCQTSSHPTWYYSYESTDSFCISSSSKKDDFFKTNCIKMKGSVSSSTWIFDYLDEDYIYIYIEF